MGIVIGSLGGESKQQLRPPVALN